MLERRTNTERDIDSILSECTKHGQNFYVQNAEVKTNSEHGENTTHHCIIQSKAQTNTSLSMRT